jgi:hypothetical protein
VLLKVVVLAEGETWSELWGKIARRGSETEVVELTVRGERQSQSRTLLGGLGVVIGVVVVGGD